MATKEKQKDDGTTQQSIKSAFQQESSRITPMVKHKSNITITRVGAGGGGGGGGDYAVKRSSMGVGFGMGNNPASGAYEQMCNMSSNIVKTKRGKEKKDMQELNERLANYIEKVRFLEAQNRKLVADLEQLRSKWGKETAQIKAIYEAELAAARKLLDDSEKGKAEMELRVQALMEEIQDLSKNNEEMTKELVIEKETIERQNQQLSDYEGELQLLRRRIGNLEKGSKKDKITIKTLQDDLARCKQDLDNETLNRVCAENDKQSLQEELDFCRKVHEQELKELSALAYRDTTTENREFWKNEMAQCLHELQCEYESKLDVMKTECEGYYNAKMQEFRTGANRNSMDSGHAREEVKRIRGQMNDSRGKITDLESKNAHLEKMMSDLQREFEEKQREWELERSELETENQSLRLELESVLQELQHLLDAKLSLELEIAAYRKLLEGEETRIGLRNVVEQVVTTQEEIVGGSIKGEMSARTTYQRSAKGTVSITECTPDGKCVVVENTGKKDEVIDSWKIVRKLDGNRPSVSYTFATCTLAPGKKLKIWSKGNKPSGSPDYEMNEKTWGTGQNVSTYLHNKDGDERASHVQKTTYSS